MDPTLVPTLLLGERKTSRSAARFWPQPPQAAERPGLRSHAERGNEGDVQNADRTCRFAFFILHFLCECHRAPPASGSAARYCPAVSGRRLAVPAFPPPAGR